ncbi:MAG: hypothetical protein ACAI38_14175 [Myxococcota bacterium]|nr:hypothetical protein [Myxococcota bacterium]
METSSPSPLLESIVATIPDPGLAGRVGATLSMTRSALDELKRVHLPQDSFEESDVETVDRHLEIAPYALSALASINRLLAHLGESYVPPAEPTTASDDFDLTFDLVDGPTGDAPGLSKEQPAGKQLSVEEQVADAAHAFGGMLRGHVIKFADRLEAALRQQDTWPLLAEIDDYKRKLTKALQGLLFGVLGVFAKDARRDEILPEYKSGVAEAVALRSTLADMTLAITRFNTAIAQSTQEAAVPLVVAVSDRLQRFATRPEFSTLRADDKKAFIDFATSLHRLRRTKGGIPMTQLKFAVEGFSKFLEAMGAINHREVLVIHDRQRLEHALELVASAQGIAGSDPEGARAKLDSAVELLAAVHGRNQDLDDQRRLHRIDPPLADDMAERLDEWSTLVQGTLQRVG